MNSRRLGRELGSFATANTPRGFFPGRRFSGPMRAVNRDYAVHEARHPPALLVIALSILTVGKIPVTVTGTLPTCCRCVLTNPSHQQYLRHPIAQGTQSCAEATS